MKRRENEQEILKKKLFQKATNENVIMMQFGRCGMLPDTDTKPIKSGLI